MTLWCLCHNYLSKPLFLSLQFYFMEECFMCGNSFVWQWWQMENFLFKMLQDRYRHRWLMWNKLLCLNYSSPPLIRPLPSKATPLIRPSPSKATTTPIKGHHSLSGHDYSHQRPPPSKATTLYRATTTPIKGHHSLSGQISDAMR